MAAQAVYGAGLSISPSRAVSYRVRLDNGRRYKGRGIGLAATDNNSSSGILSAKGAVRLENAVQWLIMAAKWQEVYSYECQRYVRFKANMVTLTLPSKQQHTDQQIKAKVLNQFLVEARRWLGLGQYVWRAETQMNGNIHFHLITTTFLEPFRLREVWNRCCEKLGYITAFEQQHGHRNPNSTDVHSIKHVRKLGSYMSKYVAKNRVWAKVGELRQVGNEVREVLYGSQEYTAEPAEQKQGKVVGSVMAGPLRKVAGRLWYASKGLSGGGKVSITEVEAGWARAQAIVAATCEKYIDTDICRIYIGSMAENVMRHGGIVADMIRQKYNEAAGNI